MSSASSIVFIVYYIRLGSATLMTSSLCHTRTHAHTHTEVLAVDKCWQETHSVVSAQSHGDLHSPPNHQVIGSHDNTPF
eukprot:m.34844 g.34844  ORF g.34844 m.34844 type:complete len:79 (+) comp14331_c0_seq1:158-394(+)